MPEFEITGDLLTDVQNAIDNNAVVHISYTDRKGNMSDRQIAPLEIRGDRLYGWDLSKNGLRLFILDQIDSYEVLDETFDPDSF
jgi:predicted DNA-binding transcriptional regulator YafY